MKSFLLEIHYFRAFAIMMIVGGHSLAVPESAAPDRAGAVLLSNIFQNGTVLFVFIAGFLFEHLSDRFEYRAYLQKKLSTVIAPYILLSIPIILYRIAGNYDAAFIPYWITRVDPLTSALAYLSTGRHMMAYWFMPMMALFFISAPFLLWLRERRCFPGLIIALTILSAFVHRSEANLNPFHSFVYFFPAYLFGMWFSVNREWAFRVCEQTWPLLAAVVVGATLYRTYVLGDFGLYLSSSMLNASVDLLWVQKILLCPLALIILREYRNAIPAEIGIVATTSFGIFFLHPYTQILASRLVEATTSGNQYLLDVFLNFALALGLSILLTQTVRKVIGPKSRMIVGC